jgi:hypothetical protein
LLEWPPILIAAAFLPVVLRQKLMLHHCF